jgi:hypothetical protein
VEQHHRLGRVPKRLQILKDLLVGYACLFSQASPRGFRFGTEAHLLDELFLSLPKVILFQPAAPISE